MRKMAIGIVIVVLIVAVVGGCFLVADYSYQKGYNLGYSKGHFDGFSAGVALETDCWLCKLINLDIAYTDDNIAPQGVIIPYVDEKGMSGAHYPLRDQNLQWDVSWVYAGLECNEHKNAITELYRENKWAGYIE